jgi:RNA polymerase sigma-70 factor, ECF subfamily
MPLVSSSELFERHGAAVYRRCRAMLGDEAGARDAVQEVFLKAHVQRATFRGEASPFTWLYSIATTHCLQQLRNAKLRQKKLESLGQEAAPRGMGPDDRLRTLALLEGFPPDVQQIVYLRHIDGLDMEEVARMTQLSTKTVSRKLHDFVERSRELASRDREEVRP